MKTYRPPSFCRVLYVGTTDGSSTAVHYFTNFLKLGYAVYAYDPDPFRMSNWRDALRVKLTKRPSLHHQRRAELNLVRLCRNHQFDLIFVMSQNFISAETLNAMKKASKFSPVMVYHSHDNNFSKGILKPKNFSQNLVAFDYVFTTKSQNVASYKALGQSQSIFIPSAYEPSVHHPIPDRYSRYKPDEFEVTFIGTYDKSRAPLLEAAGWHRLNVWGDRWNRAPLSADRRKRINGGPVNFLEYSDVLSHSKCILGLLREEAQDLHTQRTFEVAACGGLQFAPRNEEIQSFFTDKKEIVLFSSTDELRELINYYLAHPAARRAVARRGHERLLKGQHTYMDRLHEILKTAGFSSSRLSIRA